MEQNINIIIDDSARKMVLVRRMSQISEENGEKKCIIGAPTSKRLLEKLDESYYSSKFLQQFGKTLIKNIKGIAQQIKAKECLIGILDHNGETFAIVVGKEPWILKFNKQTQARRLNFKVSGFGYFSTLAVYYHYFKKRPGIYLQSGIRVLIEPRVLTDPIYGITSRDSYNIYTVILPSRIFNIRPEGLRMLWTYSGFDVDGIQYFHYLTSPGAERLYQLYRSRTKFFPKKQLLDKKKLLKILKYCRRKLKLYACNLRRFEKDLRESQKLFLIFQNDCLRCLLIGECNNIRLYTIYCITRRGGKYLPVAAIEKGLLETLQTEKWAAELLKKLPIGIYFNLDKLIVKPWPQYPDIIERKYSSYCIWRPFRNILILGRDDRVLSGEFITKIFGYLIPRI